MTESHDFFGEGSPYLDHPLLTEERTQREVDFLTTALGLPAAARLLDVGCGFGRHSVTLARLGYRVTGIDPSRAMIDAAQRRADVGGVTIDFHRTRGQDFTAADPYDGALCLFNTLGQTTPPGGDQILLNNLFRLLKPAGMLVIELARREAIVQKLQLRERFEQRNGHTEVNRRYDAHSRSLTEKFRVVSFGQERVYVLQRRLYSVEEVKTLVLRAGFQLDRVLANYEGESLAPHTREPTAHRPAMSDTR